MTRHQHPLSRSSSRRLSVGGVAVLLLLVALFLPASARAARHALLVGIDNYQSSGLHSLRGANNDVSLMRDVLEKRFDFLPANIRELRDSAATHTAIRQAFADLAASVGPDDFVYVHYSGHGSSVRDMSGDEGAHGSDSTWVPHGSRANAFNLPEDHALDAYDILDDELNQWLAVLSSRAGQVVFVSDSCHSGTISRSLAPLPTRSVPPDERIYPDALMLPSGGAPGGIRIGACRDSERASEYRAGGKVYGMFTWFWARGLMECSADTTWEELVRRTTALMEYQFGGYASQHPQVEGIRGALIFGGVTHGAGRVAVTERDGKLVQLDAGSLSGVTRDSVFTNDRGGEVRVTDTSATAAKGECSGDVRPGDLLRLVRFVPDMPDQGVAIHSKDTRQVVTVGTIIKALPGYTVAADEDADLLVRFTAHNRLKLTGADTRPLLFDNKGGDLALTHGWEERFKATLVRLAKARRLLTLTPPHGVPLPVVFEATVWRPAPSGGFEQWGTFDGELTEEASLRSGDKITFALQNTSSQPYYCYLIGLTPEGAIQPFYPPAELGMEYGLLQPGQRVDTADTVSLFMDSPGRAFVRLLVCRTPVDVSLLYQEGTATTDKELSSGGGGQEWNTDMIVFDIQ